MPAVVHIDLPTRWWYCYRMCIMGGRGLGHTRNRGCSRYNVSVVLLVLMEAVLVVDLSSTSYYCMH